MLDFAFCSFVKALLRYPFFCEYFPGLHQYMHSLYNWLTLLFLCQNERAGQKILITGTDDPYRYYTIQELRALETSGYDFKIALVHTSELYDLAAENNYDLYLCGHTHGGQICLFNGKPLITHQYEGSRFVKGLWYYLCLRSEILRTSCI
jgi:predicted MPP superfamily phosphohydrolase